MKRLLILLILMSFGYGQRLVRVGAEWTFDDFIPSGLYSFISTGHEKTIYNNL